MRLAHVTPKEIFRAWIIFTITSAVLATLGSFVILTSIDIFTPSGEPDWPRYLKKGVVLAYNLCLSYFLFRWVVRRFLLINGSRPVEDVPGQSRP